MHGAKPICGQEGRKGKDRNKADQINTGNKNKELSDSSPDLPMFPYLQLSRGCFFFIVEGGWGGGLHFLGRLVRKISKRSELHTRGLVRNCDLSSFGASGQAEGHPQGT